MSAATRIFATQGLGAPTAAIAKEAGVSNGSLFTYFDTKADLLNELFVDAKAEMSTAAVSALPESDTRAQMLHIWSQWMRWASTNPEKRRLLALLQVSDEITPSSHEAASRGMTAIGGVLERIRANGALRHASAAFVFALANALAEATIDFVLSDPEHADEHIRDGFDALWRMIG
jgi:AcrR family transcriptional regulator